MVAVSSTLVYIVLLSSNISQLLKVIDNLNYTDLCNLSRILLQWLHFLLPTSGCIKSQCIFYMPLHGSNVTSRKFITLALLLVVRFSLLSLNNLVRALLIRFSCLVTVYEGVLTGRLYIYTIVFFMSEINLSLHSNSITTIDSNRLTRYCRKALLVQLLLLGQLMRNVSC